MKYLLVPLVIALLLWMGRNWRRVRDRREIAPPVSPQWLNEHAYDRGWRHHR